jgi:hypothetical protein
MGTVANEAFSIHYWYVYGVSHKFLNFVASVAKVAPNCPEFERVRFPFQRDMTIHAHCTVFCRFMNVFFLPEIMMTFTADTCFPRLGRIGFLPETFRDEENHGGAD